MNPLAWWDMLQANFRQIAQAATLDSGTFAANAAGSGMSGARRAADSSPPPGRARKTADKSGGKAAGAARGGRNASRAADRNTVSNAARSPGPADGPMTRQKRRKSGGAGGTG